MKRVLRNLKLEEISLVDAPANPGARVLLAKVATGKPVNLDRLRALTGLARIEEIERLAQAAEPDLAKDNAIEFFLRRNAAVRVLYAQAQAEASGRDANAKRAAGEQLDHVEVLRKRAERESEQPSMGQVFEKIQREASSRYGRLFEKSAQAAIDKVLREEPELYDEYRRARRSPTSARAAYAHGLVLEEIAPLTRFLLEDGDLSEREASAQALELVPAAKARRDELVEKAHAGARLSWGEEDPFEKGHVPSFVMSMSIVAAARSVLKMGKAQTGVEAVLAALAEDLALGARARGDEAGAERLAGLSKSAIESDPEAYREYRRRR